MYADMMPSNRAVHTLIFLALGAAISGVGFADADAGSRPAHAGAPASDAALVSDKDGLSDSWITTKVKSALLADSVGKAFTVSVETHHGIVILKGELHSRDAVYHVRDVAQSVEGVKSVDTSELTADGSG